MPRSRCWLMLGTVLLVGARLPACAVYDESLLVGNSSSAAGGFSGAAAGGTGSGGSPTSSCLGVAYQDIYWYLGNVGASCDDTCLKHGGPSANASAHIGTSFQGGSIAECAEILGMLGVTGSVNMGVGSPGQALGCQVYPAAPSSNWWLLSPDFSASAHSATARIVCGCNC
jgi:hypothetical protein